MQRIPTIFALILIAGCATEDASLTGAAQSKPRIVRQTDLPLLPAAEPAGTEGGEKAFGAGPTRGWVKASGDWSFTTQVTHSRLRCATYQAGIQLGNGDASCSRVGWLTSPVYGAKRTQCNGATLIHSGGGKIAFPKDPADPPNCVRVIVRCTGAC
jgi:hypothetical protein